MKIRSCSSGVEHFLGKEEVMGSNPIMSSTKIRKFRQITESPETTQNNFGWLQNSKQPKHHSEIPDIHQLPPKR